MAACRSSRNIRRTANYSWQRNIIVNKHRYPTCYSFGRKYLTTISDVVESADKKDPRNIRSNKSTAFYRATKIHDTGNSVRVSLTVADIIRGSLVHARDLFSLALSKEDEDDINTKKDESMFRVRRRSQRRNPPPAILPRGEKIIVCFGCIKAVIGKDEGLLFGTRDPNTKLLVQSIETVVKNRSCSSRHSIDPFEIIFLEEILLHVCSTWSRRVLLYGPIVNSLSGVSDQMYHSQINVQRHVPLRDSLQSFEMQISQTYECLTELLNDDVDMVSLLLTAKANAKEEGKKVEVELHESVELLLEEYARQLQNMHQEVNYLLRKVESNQELVMMSLDTYRNQILRFSLYLNVAAVCLATSTTVAGYFGMNLAHGLETSDYAFAGTVIGSTIFSSSVYFISMHYLSASRITKDTVSQYQEIETITNALSNLNAVDFAMNLVVESNEIFTRDEFKSKFRDGILDGHKISDDEIDLFFNILDTSGDGILQQHDIFLQLQKEKRNKV